MITTPQKQKFICLTRKVIGIERELKELNKIKFLESDYVLPFSEHFLGKLIVKNISTTNTIFIQTLNFDKLEGEDAQPLYPGESFTIIRYNINDYRII